MFNYKETLQKMMSERDSMRMEIDKINQAIAAVQSLTGNAAPARAKSGLSAQARRRISLAQKKRWAKVREGGNRNERNTRRARRKISAEGLRNIVEAQRKRWAKVRAAAKAKAASGKKGVAK